MKSFYLSLLLVIPISLCANTQPSIEQAVQTIKEKKHAGIKETLVAIAHTTKDVVLITGVAVLCPYSWPIKLAFMSAMGFGKVVGDKAEAIAQQEQVTKESHA